MDKKTIHRMSIQITTKIFLLILQTLKTVDSKPSPAQSQLLQRHTAFFRIKNNNDPDVDKKVAFH